MPGKTTLSDHAVLYLPVSTFVGTGFLFTLCKEKLMKRHLNTSYRLVWNHITGTLVVASELARSRENAPVWRLRCLLLLSHQSRHWLLTRLYRREKP